VEGQYRSGTAKELVLIGWYFKGKVKVLTHLKMWSLSCELTREGSPTRDPSPVAVSL